MTSQEMLALIDKVQTAINDFIYQGDDYIAGLNYDAYTTDGEAVRQMQSRLSRIASDLSNLYRRLDS